MLKVTSVKGGWGLGENGWWRYDRWEGGLKKVENQKKKRKGEKKETKKSIERKEWIVPFLCKLNLLGRTCVELYAHLFFNINLFLHCNCPRAEIHVVVHSHLLQILLIWARIKLGNSPFWVGLGCYIFGPFNVYFIE